MEGPLHHSGPSEATPTHGQQLSATMVYLVVMSTFTVAFAIAWCAGLKLWLWGLYGVAAVREQSLYFAGFNPVTISNGDRLPAWLSFLIWLSVVGTALCVLFPLLWMVTLRLLPRTWRLAGLGFKDLPERSPRWGCLGFALFVAPGWLLQGRLPWLAPLAWVTTIALAWRSYFFRRL